MLGRRHLNRRGLILDRCGRQRWPSSIRSRCRREEVSCRLVILLLLLLLLWWWWLLLRLLLLLLSLRRCVVH